MEKLYKILKKKKKKNTACIIFLVAKIILYLIFKYKIT